MEKDNFLEIIKSYKDQFEGILSRFSKDSAGLWINRDDDPIYRQKVQEVTDFLKDNFSNNPYSKQIQINFVEGISNFYRTPSYKSIENIISILGAIITRVSRNPEILNSSSRPKEMEEMDKETTKNLGYEEKVTFKWLWEHVPASMWFKFGSILVLVFTIGLYSSGIPFIKNILRQVPGYKVNLVLSQNTQKNIESQVKSLIDGHNQRLEKLQEQLLGEEKLAGDHNLIASYRDYHKEAAQRIQNIIKNENDNFQSEIKVLKSFLED